MTETIPITVLSGSLGAGKTTTLSHVLDTADREIAVVVNDMGEINVDAELIETQTTLGDGDSRVAALSNGCICCGLQGELRNELFGLAHEYDFDYLVIESSGISEPAPIARLFAGRTALSEHYHVDTMVTVVDAPRVAATFDADEHPTREGPNETGRRPLSDLTIEQIEFSDVLVCNKRDLVDDATADRVETIVRSLQPSAAVRWTAHGRIDPEAILGTARFDFESASRAAAWKRAVEHADAHDHGTDHDHDRHSADHDHGDGHDHDHDHGDGHDHDHDHGDGHDHGDDHDHLHPPEAYGVDSIVYRRSRPFHPARFREWLESPPSTLIRSKGLVWVAGRESQSLMLSQVGSQVRIRGNGRWVASLPEAHQAAYRRVQPDLAWDERWGDREIRLALIGTRFDPDRLRASLDACLLTDAEFDGDWEAFDNPFPALEGGIFSHGIPGDLSDPITVDESDESSLDESDRSTPDDRQRNTTSRHQ
ncbi:CobW family GTP-binding protein [Haloferacaceae archaeon DSL9]